MMKFVVGRLYKVTAVRNEYLTEGDVYRCTHVSRDGGTIGLHRDNDHPTKPGAGTYAARYKFDAVEV